MAPTRSPMGVMLISAPSVKNMMPTMIMAAPSRKQSRMLGETGAMLKQRHQHDGHDGQDGLKRLQQLFPEFGDGCFDNDVHRPFPPGSSAAGR